MTKHDPEPIEVVVTYADTDDPVAREKLIEVLVALLAEQRRRAPDDWCAWCGAPKGACDCAERIACKRAGEPGHWFCGTCPTCGQPRFRCGIHGGIHK